MKNRIEASRQISASPETVWNIISDLESMGNLSSENYGGRWKKGFNGVEKGAIFRGKNKNGWRRWRTNVLVTECEEPNKLAFSLRVARQTWCEWAYQIEASENGCWVTESWTDTRTWPQVKIGWIISGVPNRAEHNFKSIESTLDNLVLQAETR